MVILIYGLQGTGKTTLGKILSEELNAPLLTTEKCRKHLFEIPNSTKDEDFTPEQLIITYNAIYYSVETMISQSDNIIVDGVFRSDKQRQRLKRICDAYKTNFFDVYLSCSVILIKKRLLNRLKNKSTAPAGILTYEKTKAIYEYPNNPKVVFNSCDDKYQNSLKLLLNRIKNEE